MPILVNGERIEDQALQAETMRLQQSGAGNAAAEMAKRHLVEQTLMRQEAKQRGYQVSPAEIEQGLHKLFMNHGGRESFLQRHRLGEADEPMLREHVAANRRIEKLIDDICADVPAPSAETVRAYYDAHPGEFVQPERVHAAHIVKQPTSADDEATFATLCEVRRRLRSGEDFATLAGEYSDCQSEPGGDLGFFAKGQMVPGFEVVAFSMEPGEISPVFSTQFGLHVLKVLAREEARPLAFADLEGKLAKRLHDDARDETFGAYLEQLRAKATIQDRPAAKSGKKGGK